MHPTHAGNSLKKLAHPRYSLLSPAENARLSAGRSKFSEIFSQEMRRHGIAVPNEAMSKWIVSQDLGRLTGLWEHCLDAVHGTGPLLAQDILAIHGLHPKSSGPSFYSREVVRDLMSKKDAYALPIADYRGNYLATIIHVGPEATEKAIRQLAQSLIRDPTGTMHLS